MTVYRVVVAGRLPDAVARLLSDLGADPVDVVGPCSAVEVVDQAALIVLIDRMHSLGLTIDHVDRIE